LWKECSPLFRPAQASRRLERVVVVEELDSPSMMAMVGRVWEMATGMGRACGRGEKV
jgi:hypothetical protein